MSRIEKVTVCFFIVYYLVVSGGMLYYQAFPPEKPARKCNCCCCLGCQPGCSCLCGKNCNCAWHHCNDPGCRCGKKKVALPKPETPLQSVVLHDGRARIAWIDEEGQRQECTLSEEEFCQLNAKGEQEK